LAPEALPLLEAFAQDAQHQQSAAGGLMRSAFGKVRGLSLRLSLVLEMLWWCGEGGMTAAPSTISERAFLAAANLLDDYFMVSAERVYGDAATTRQDRNAATLARWIIAKRPDDVHVRHLLREVRLPGLTDAELIHEAANVLVEADWLRVPPSGREFGPRGRVAYAINPRVGEMAP
jgi:Protein of unknown function (DUF3987)